MIIGGDKQPVILNIEKAVSEQRFNDKVEVNDPSLTPAEEKELISNFLKQKNRFSYRRKNLLARAGITLLTKGLMATTKVDGIEKIVDIETGAIVTSNHFNPLENMAVRKAILKGQGKRLAFVSQASNLKMPGVLGFFMNYGDVIPLSASTHYMNHDFFQLLEEHLTKGHHVLIYPEQEMWFNYQKPRPVKRGPYYFAAKAQVPIISCFVEMRPLAKNDNDQFKKVRYILHVLAPIYPNPNLTIEQNSRQMMATDYQQTKQAYEKAHGKALTYDFEPTDIVGWRK